MCVDDRLGKNDECAKNEDGSIIEGVGGGVTLRSGIRELDCGGDR